MGEIIELKQARERRQTVQEEADGFRATYGRPFKRWPEGMAHVELADAANEIAWWRYRDALETWGRDHAQTELAYEAFRACEVPRVIANYRLMVTPAPDQRAVRWKEVRRKAFGGSEAWDRAIAEDRAQLAAKSARRKRIVPLV
jgi:hypothetical protein